VEQFGGSLIREDRYQGTVRRTRRPRGVLGSMRVFTGHSELARLVDERVSSRRKGMTGGKEE
jgi:hypothetical protein